MKVFRWVEFIEAAFSAIAPPTPARGGFVRMADQWFSATATKPCLIRHVINP
jgi:hypothetical protein